MQTANIKRLAKFIKTRHGIYTRRAAGQLPPWTLDPILRQWRFCNIYRELDKVTCWISTYWRTPYQNDPDLWFAMAVARFVNEPEVLELIGYPVPWRRDVFIDIMNERRRAHKTMFNPAYIIVPHNTSTPKAPHIADKILTPLWECRKGLRPTSAIVLLYTYCTTLKKMPGIGSFMAGQIIADLKYVAPLDAAQDWWTFAASGPGSRRGLNRIIGRDIKASWPEAKWCVTLTTLQQKLTPYVADLPRLHAQDVQNVLCEFDKYERVRLGEGTPRRKYSGGASCHTTV
jgi:hypothetical protein